MQGQTTTTMQAHADILLAEPKWSRGVDLRNGREFFTFSGSKGELHRASVDGCTCRGYFYRLVCAHVIAVRERLHEEAMEAGLATDAEIDCAFASVAATARARDEAYGRQASIMASIDYHIGE